MARTKVFNEEEVLGKAVKLFWEKGYNGTSAQDLVDRLGISRSSLYDTYGDKFRLFKRSLLQYRKEFAGSMIEMIHSSDDYEKTLVEVFEYVVTESLQEKFSKGCFMVNSSVEMAPHNPEIAEIVNGNRQDIEDALLQLIKKGQETGQFSKKHGARPLARFIFNTISGLRVTSKSGADKKVFDDIVTIALAALK
ncbi:TetR family transcriptional regulator [Flavobacterium cyanobacteriorum]|uniref:TetR family transcriptional regulator n=1 Tax=Flavobacterium cyanobacteriorum TaxID=2022802 RepID=A0A255YRL5_9FLAO|nr:TetR/AcrR family transcriptional regulator [Flavobacterium cyanobacteriorum]OYQ31866.1 TetR family transcriptional regulator [Flavobacterium cyanobacteriorum]